jgi:ubiquinone/menaquinone biosynthesis C-methylase UbiE
MEVRALRRRLTPDVALVGIDHSSALVDRVRRETADEGLSENVEYVVGDVHDLPYPDAHFEVVTLHTLISHVDDPGRVLAETRRVLRPGDRGHLRR